MHTTSFGNRAVRCQKDFLDRCHVRILLFSSPTSLPKGLQAGSHHLGRNFGRASPRLRGRSICQGYNPRVGARVSGDL